MNGEWDEILETLSDIRQVYPDFRFGQLISNLPGFATGDDGVKPVLWDIEDEQLLEGAKAMLAAFQARIRERQPVAV